MQKRWEITMSNRRRERRKTAVHTIKPGVFLLCLSLVWGATLPASSAGRVVDGDTIVVAGVVYRLFGIDAPEAGQKCVSQNGKKWPCGKAAIAEMERLVLLAKDLSCDNHGLDDYGRTIAVCIADGKNINEAMIEAGLAWSFRKYSHDYDNLEETIHLKQIGVWQAPTQTPWEYRAAKWAVSKFTLPTWLLVKPGDPSPRPDKRSSVLYQWGITVARLSWGLFGFSQLFGRCLGYIHQVQIAITNWLCLLGCVTTVRE